MFCSKCRANHHFHPLSKRLYRIYLDIYFKNVDYIIYWMLDMGKTYVWSLKIQDYILTTSNMEYITPSNVKQQLSKILTLL
jgi:hypothetical protein